MTAELNDAEYRHRVKQLVNQALASRDSITTLLTGLRHLNAIRKTRNVSAICSDQKVTGLIHQFGYNPWEVVEAC